MRDPRHPPTSLSDPQRLSSLARTDLLDTPADPYFDRITRLVAKLVGVDTALLSLVTDERQFFKSSCGLSGWAAEARETPLSHSFCKFVVTSGKAFIVNDAHTLPELTDNRAIDELGVIAYLGVPIHAPDGRVIGSLCALGSEPRQWSDEDLATMHDLAAFIDDDLRLRERARRSDQLAQDNAILAREYHHRVKNALAVSASLVRLSGKDATSVDDLIEKAGDRLAALADAHDQLILESDAVDLEELSSRLLLPYCIHGSTADVAGPRVALAHTQITPVCFFLHELATNSAKYGAFKTHGRVSLRWTAADEMIEIEWNEQLTDATQRSPQGFGSRLIESAARQLGGETSTMWMRDGLFVTLRFPKPQATADD